MNVINIQSLNLASSFAVSHRLMCHFSINSIPHHRLLKLHNEWLVSSSLFYAGPPMTSPLLSCMWGIISGYLLLSNNKPLQIMYGEQWFNIKLPHVGGIHLILYSACAICDLEWLVIVQYIIVIVQ